MDEYGWKDTHGRTFGELLWLRIEDIRIAEPFKSLFPFEEARVEVLKERIDWAGYDKGWPVTVWENKKDTLIDGFHRLEAARRSDSTDGWVFVNRRKFGDELQALEYALSAQGQRRNMSDWDIYHAVRLMENRREHGGKRKKAGRKPKIEEISNNAINQLDDRPIEKRALEQARVHDERKRLSYLLQIGERKIKYCLALLKHGIDEEIELIKEQSLHAAYNALRKRMRESAKEEGNQIDLGLFWHYRQGQVFIKRYGRVERLVEFNTHAFPSVEDRGDFEQDVRTVMDRHLKRWTQKEINGLEELDEYERKEIEKADGEEFLL